MKHLRLHLVAASLFILIALLVLNACKHQPGTIDGGYPTAINKIVMTKCVNAGCHNAASAEGAAGLNMDTWDHLFNGSTHGAVVIPYDIQYSSLLYYMNTDSSEGIVGIPTMPLNGTPLTKDEYNTMRDWIAAGAPDKNGNIPFGSNPATRQKIYMTVQGCDLLSVVDAERNVIMRNIRIGKNPALIEAPHCVRVSPDGNYAYVSFLKGLFMQKIDTRTDQIVGEAQISPDTSSQWNILHVSDDGTKVMAADFARGGFVFVNAADMSVTTTYAIGAHLYNYPHGIAANAAFDTFYVTSQNGNTVYKIYRRNGGFNFKSISIDGLPASSLSSRDPHEILMTPDHSRYFLTCQTSNEVRVMDSYADTVVGVFPVPNFPQELALSSSKPYMFVTCMEAVSPRANAKGCVVVINYQTMSEVTRIYGDFYQPHGVTVDDKNGLFYVASANVDQNGPAPHHVSACAGRDGWYSVYNLNTFEPVNAIRYETAVYPYSVDARFKQ